MINFSQERRISTLSVFFLPFGCCSFFVELFVGHIGLGRFLKGCVSKRECRIYLWPDPPTPDLPKSIPLLQADQSRAPIFQTSLHSLLPLRSFHSRAGHFFCWPLVLRAGAEFPFEWGVGRLTTARDSFMSSWGAVRESLSWRLSFSPLGAPPLLLFSRGGTFKEEMSIPCRHVSSPAPPGVLRSRPYPLFR